MSALDEVIGPKLIARAEQRGACSEALVWLREAPRTWSELRRRRADWLAWGIDHGLAGSVLPEMMRDSDPYLRLRVARLIASEHLPEMMRDSDPYVRCRVARRIDPAHLPAMMRDSDANVRGIAAQRLGGGS